MNSPISGILALLLFAYCTPTQGYRYTIVEAELQNGKRCSTGFRSRTAAFLIRKSLETYAIEVTDHGSHGSGKHEITTLETFDMEGIDTMLREDDVVIRTSNNSWIRMELPCLQDAQRLFDATTRSKLGAPHSSYNVSAVYEFNKSDVLSNVSISEFEYSTTGVPQRRLVIHSGGAGEASSSAFDPQLLWTEGEFNYSASSDSITLTVRPKPGGRAYKYYFVKFQKSSDLNEWTNGPGQRRNRGIPLAPRQVTDFFSRKT